MTLNELARLIVEEGPGRTAFEAVAKEEGVTVEELLDRVARHIAEGYMSGVYAFAHPGRFRRSVAFGLELGA